MFGNSAPRVLVANSLAKKMQAIGEDPQYLAKTFGAWKALGEAGEYSSIMFGKDAFYERPTGHGGRLVLRHVHLVPVLDREARERWRRVHQRGGRKTSDRALVYAQDARHGFLLIHIAEEPTAHAMALMEDPKSNMLMQLFAQVAQEFIQTGKTDF